MVVLGHSRVCPCHHVAAQGHDERANMAVGPLSTDVAQSSDGHVCPFPHMDVLEHGSHANVHPHAPANTAGSQTAVTMPTQ